MVPTVLTPYLRGGRLIHFGEAVTTVARNTGQGPRGSGIPGAFSHPRPAKPLLGRNIATGQLQSCKMGGMEVTLWSHPAVL